MPTEVQIDGTPYSFVAWKDDHLSFYAVDKTGVKVVVEPRLPSVDNIRWREGFHFPKQPPTSIEPVRLIPPPCRASEQAAASVSDGWRELAKLWERVYGEVLYPKSEHDEELKLRLDAFLREQEGKKAADLAKLKNFRKKADREQQERLIMQIYHGNGPLACCLVDDRQVGTLDVTLEIVKSHNVAGIRDQCLREFWARDRGFNLESMEREKHRFLAFAKENLVCKRLDAKSDRYRWTDTFDLSEDESMALLASVRFLLRFGATEGLYIAGFDRHRHLTRKEHEDFELLLNSSEAVPANGGIVQHGRLKYSAGFQEVWFDDEVYDLRERGKARHCIQYLVEQKGFSKDTARHLETEIDPYVRVKCDLPPAQLSEVKIHHYFNGKKGKLPKLCKLLIHPAGRNGKYYLKTE